MSSDRRPRIGSAEILAIGAELLFGETRDTNGGDLARELHALGVEVVRISLLPDRLEVVTQALRAALGRADLVITSGGLGPTPDDLTRESIAAALDEVPQVDPELDRWLRDIWARRGLPFSEVNLKQAWLIHGAQALPNPNGTAPGWWVERPDGMVIALPGPPRELAPMWREQALPRLQALGLGLDRAAETLHLVGIGESALVDLIGIDLLSRRNPELATYARPDWVDLRVSAVATAAQDAGRLVAETIAALTPRLEPYLLGRDDEDWIAALAPRLAGRSLAVHEVGTAGFVGRLLGGAPFLQHAEQTRGRGGTARQAADLRARTGADVALTVEASEQRDDTAVAVAVAIGGRTSEAASTAFRTGEAGRRRAAGSAIAELWRQLAD
jgi:nicotinamide-nucleotide amidase